VPPVLAVAPPVLAAAPPVPAALPPVAVLPLDSVCDPEQPAVKSKRAKDMGPSFE